MNGRFHAVTVCTVLLCGCPVPGRAQEHVRMELHPRAVTVAPQIDGVLNDEAWTAEPLALDAWATYNPLRGEPARFQTSVWAAYDPKALYIAFHCLDPEPSQIKTSISRRDTVFNDDWVGLSLDSSAAGQVAYHMFV